MVTSPLILNCTASQLEYSSILKAMTPAPLGIYVGHTPGQTYTYYILSRYMVHSSYVPGVLVMRNIHPVLQGRSGSETNMHLALAIAS